MALNNQRNSALASTSLSSPSNVRNSQLRSNTKSQRPDLRLCLKQVIGTTACSQNSIDSLPAANTFAFTAGAAVVVARIDDDLNLHQRFFRARPSPNLTLPSGPLSNTPSNAETRNKANLALRDPIFGYSPSGSNDPQDSSKGISARDRIKAATCVGFSPDGKFLAVGESGFKPRVLIFSISPDASCDTPIATISDHSFGVRSVAFSADSQYLATLGYTNDGFIYIWSISKNGSASLLACNKCTSSVNGITWMGNALITVGTRHVKVWRVAEQNISNKAHVSESLVNTAGNTQKALIGRNCLLKSLIDATFTAVTSLDSSRAIVGSDRGDLCLVDDRGGLQKFSKLLNLGTGISAFTVHSGQAILHIASKDGKMTRLPVQPILDTDKFDEPLRTIGPVTDSSFVGIASLENSYVAVDDQRTLSINEFDYGNPDVDSDSKIKPQKLPGHASAVWGVRAFSGSLGCDSFYTWSADGSLNCWKCDGEFSRRIDLNSCGLFSGDECNGNELRVVQEIPEFKQFITGDKGGFIRLYDDEGNMGLTIKAHASEITDICLCMGEEKFFATSSRDRCVQVFQYRSDQWELLQTLEEHTAAVTGIKFSRNGQLLISCSSDRTIVVRECLSRSENDQTFYAFLASRTITLKTTPTCMSFDPFKESVLLVCSIDRRLHRIDTNYGQILSSVKTGDPDTGEAVVLTSITVFPDDKNGYCIAGVSSSDKSVRVYNERGNLLSRDWGHTEGISGIASLNKETTVDESSEVSETGAVKPAVSTTAADLNRFVTVAVDGTIFIWDSVIQRSVSGAGQDGAVNGLDGSGNLNDRERGLTSGPARRIMSPGELQLFQQSRREVNETPCPSPPAGLSRKGGTLRKRTTPRTSKIIVPSDISSPPSLRRIATSQGNNSGSGASRCLSPRMSKGGTGSRLGMNDDRRTGRQHRQAASQRNSRSYHINNESLSSLDGATVTDNETMQEEYVRGSSACSVTIPYSYSRTSSPTTSRNMDIAANQALRGLRNLRRKLSRNTADALSSEQLRDLEIEMGQVAQCLGVKVFNRVSVDEMVLIRLLDAHSAKIMEMLDNRLAYQPHESPGASNHKRMYSTYVSSETSASSITSAATQFSPNLTSPDSACEPCIPTVLTVSTDTTQGGEPVLRSTSPASEIQAVDFACGDKPDRLHPHRNRAAVNAANVKTGELENSVSLRRTSISSDASSGTEPPAIDSKISTDHESIDLHATVRPPDS